MDHLLPLTVAVPLLAAAALTAAKPLLATRRRVLDGAAILTAAAVAVMAIIIMARTASGDATYWFGGFRPVRGVAIGIDFEAGPLSAGLAALAATLVTASMVFSWRYFTHVATYFQALMLLFLAGMSGFCLTGDIFDMFVWFELMGVAAYALTAYRPEERGPLQGALNFAITNSVGAYLSLAGIALLYGRTGALNMAQIGVYLARHPGGRLAVIAFLLLIAGLLVKSAIVPFHFWLADAHAVAPSPVCILFSGVMVELGLYGIARVYWSMFAAGLAHREVISAVFMTLGLVTAVTGALFCFRERHIKRLLAFSTISHSGMFLTGFAMLTPLGLTGAAVYVAGHALVKGALFCGAGIALHRLGSVDETRLHGRGRHLRLAGVAFTLAGLGLADLPPFGTFTGKAWIETPGTLVPLLLCTVLAGGAVLRVAFGVFYGLGDPPSEDPQMAEETKEETGETEQARQRTPLSMLIPACALAAAGLGIGLIRPLGQAVGAAAVRFTNQSAYNAAVLGPRYAVPGGPFPSPHPADITLPDVGFGLLSAAGAVLLALWALYWRRIPVLRRLPEPGRGLTAPIMRFQSGIINDYVTWLVLGMACLGAALALALH